MIGQTLVLFNSRAAYVLTAACVQHLERGQKFVCTNQILVSLTLPTDSTLMHRVEVAVHQLAPPAAAEQYIEQLVAIAAEKYLRFKALRVVVRICLGLAYPEPV